MTDIACAILMRNGEILMAKRAAHKKLYPNHWDLVGGHVEAGESVDAALIREVEEEVGVTPTAFRLVEVISEPSIASDETTRYPSMR